MNFARVGGDDEVGREHHVRAHARGGAVDRGDDRLLAVEHRGDEALRVVLDVAGDVAHRALGRALGTFDHRGRLRAQVGTGAEVLARGGQHDRARTRRSELALSSSSRSRTR